MAKVRLFRGEVAEGRLPRVCMRCGDAATTERSRRFAWYPQWVYVLLFAGVLPFAIVAAVLTKRMQVHVPLCDRHKNHWLARNLLIYLSLFGMLVLGAGVIFLMANMPPARGGRNDLSAFMCVGMLGLAAVWLITVSIAQSTAIRPNEITDRTITLIKVSTTFVDAVEQRHEEWDRARRREYDQSEDWDDRQRRRAREEGGEQVRDPESRRRMRPRNDEHRDWE